MTITRRILTRAGALLATIAVATAPVLTTSLEPVTQPVAQAQEANQGGTCNQGGLLCTGHVDAFNVKAENGGLTLNLKEDITGSHVERAPEGVILKVNEEAYTDKTTNVQGINGPGYFLPQVQDPKLLWPGWDTLGVQAAGIKGVDIQFNSVDGPGKVYLFATGSFGGVEPLLKDSSLELKSGSVREQTFPAHTHANWVFTKPGTYTMNVQASAKDQQGRQLTSQAHTYTWEVGTSSSDTNQGGDSSNTNQGGDASHTHEDAGKNAATLDPSSTAAANSPSTASGQASTTPHGQTAGGQAAGGKLTKAQQAAGHTAGGQAPACVKGQPGLVALIKDDRQSPPRWVSPSSVTFGLGEQAKVNLPQNLGPVQRGPAWMIGSTQQPNVPWVGTNTMHPDLLANTTGDVTFKLTSFSGPGAMFVFQQGNLGTVVGEKWFEASGGSVSGAHVIPRNSHVHPNWVFSAPGTYKVGITQTATLKNGSPSSAQATLTFIVGGSGNANSGHFDFGSTVSTDAQCAGEAAAGGAGAAAGSGETTGSSAGGQALAETGASPMTISLLVIGLGTLVLGGGVLYYLRSTRVLAL